MKFRIVIPNFHGTDQVQRTGTRRDEAYVWRVHTGAELDLLIRQDGEHRI